MNQCLYLPVARMGLENQEPLDMLLVRICRRKILCQHELREWRFRRYRSWDLRFATCN